MGSKRNISIFAGLGLIIVIILYIVLFGNRVKPTGSGNQFLIGMSQCSQAEPYRAQMNEDIQIAASMYDNVKIILTDARRSNENQIKDIQYLMDAGIDILIVAPNETTPLNDIVSKAYETIPVIVLDRKISSENYTLFIGADNYKIGRKAGEYLVSVFGEQEANIVEIHGRLRTSATFDRSKGFYDAIKESPNIVITKKIMGDWLRDFAEDSMTDYLQNDGLGKTIDAIYAHNDPMAFGAYKALLNENIVVKHIIGIDGLEGSDGGIDLVKNGILDVTFVYPTGGQEAIEYAIRILNGEKFSQKNIVLASEMIK